MSARFYRFLMELILEKALLYNYLQWSTRDLLERQSAMQAGNCISYTKIVWEMLSEILKLYADVEKITSVGKK